MLLSKRAKITNVGENVAKRKPLGTSGGNVNWCSFYRKYTEIAQRSKHRPAVRPSSFPSRHLSRGGQDLEEVSALHVSCSISHNSQDVETARVSIDGGLDRGEVRYRYTH